MARRFDPVHRGSPRFLAREVGPYLVTDAWFPPGLVLPPHEHERAVVAVTMAGGWDSRMNGRPHACARGTVLVEPAGERHANRFGAAGGRVVVLQPDLARREAFEPARGALDAPGTIGAAPAPAIGRRLLQELGAPDAVSPLAIEALCLELLALTARQAAAPEPRTPAWLGRAVDYLHAHARQPFALAQVAAEAGVHPAHLAREFRRRFHTSVAAYVRGLRLAWAAERLSASDEPIVQIAAGAGFADQSHFTRAFRQYCGRTPRAFREARSACLRA